jgi:hypothetical protein
MNTNRLRKYSINFVDAEVWSLEALLNLIEKQAEKSGLGVTTTTCNLLVELEGFDDSSDFDGFADKLRAKRLDFGFELEED